MRAFRTHSVSDRGISFCQVPIDPPMDILMAQRQNLLGQIEQERQQISALEQVVQDLSQQLERRQHVLEELDSVLGMTHQLRLDEASVLLRGRRLSEIAIEVLVEERGAAAEVHYTEWFSLLKEKGHLVAGKQPLNTFLTQINRSPVVRAGGAQNWPLPPIPELRTDGATSSRSDDRIVPVSTL